MLHVIVKKQAPEIIIVFQGFSDKKMADRYISQNFSNYDIIAVPFPVLQFYSDPDLEKIHLTKSSE